MLAAEAFREGMAHTRDILWRLCTEPHCGPLPEKALCSQCGEHCRLRRTRMEWLDLKCRKFPQEGRCG